ncbi:MAG: cobalt ECF transporter T component CbiQ, partial [Candidatus Methanoplasma sp.]|nr:cobalt ECF transporter T component CbiQ [Candidatus Methanoplasma sp.]
AAYGSPMLRWLPLSKLFLVLSLLVLDIASSSIWMSVFAGMVGLSLLLYGSSLKMPRAMVKLFLIAQTFIIIGAFIFTFVTSGETVASVTILGMTVNFTGAGISFALLIYARATAALLLMFAFAVSTPVPHLASALRKLRFPDVFVEMMVLIYRYTFLLMESAERMHLAAECRFGYQGYKRSAKTTSRLAVGVFMRSLDTAEKGQATLQCRNYRGEFRSLSEFGKQSRSATAFCVLIICVGVIFFLALRYGVLPV